MFGAAAIQCGLWQAGNSARPRHELFRSHLPFSLAVSLRLTNQRAKIYRGTSFVLGMRQQFFQSTHFLAHGPKWQQFPIDGSRSRSRPGCAAIQAINPWPRDDA